MKPQRCNQSNPECGAFYRAVNLVLFVYFINDMRKENGGRDYSSLKEVKRDLICITKYDD